MTTSNIRKVLFVWILFEFMIKLLAVEFVSSSPVDPFCFNDSMISV